MRRITVHVIIQTNRPQDTCNLKLVTHAFKFWLLLQNIIALHIDMQAHTKETSAGRYVQLGLGVT